MIQAAETACSFALGKRRGDLDDDQMLLFALVRAIEIVGEAASKVGEATREASTDIPWPLIVSMRNRLVHAYFNVDHEVVWKTATEELPQLLPRLRALVENTKGEA
ncbi:MAG: HepT-like ribonuclease domain-containing protein [Stellaceae bacterium]